MSVPLHRTTLVSGQSRSRAWTLARLLGACLALYLLWPALSATHVEGFTAQIQSLALVLAEQGSVAGHDLARPLVSQFIFLTRPGVVDLLAAADRLFGYTGDLGFRVLTVLSLAALLVGSAFVAVRQARISFFAAMLACVLTPGLVELGFYFNDNVVSAAFAALAMAVVSVSGGFGAAALAGVLFGAAVLCRIDAVLAGPLLLLVFLLREQKPAAAVARLALAGVAALAVHLVVARINGGTLLDALRITKIFAGQHLSGHGRLPGQGAVLFFFGALAPVLVLIGAWTHWAARPAGWRLWAWVTAFYLYPALLLLYVLRTTLEIRYFLPLLAPVVAVHAGKGLATLGAWLRGDHAAKKRWALALTALGALLFLAPPAVPLMRDGPRVLVGRAWSPLLWKRWQQAVDADMDKVADVVASASAQPVSTVVSTHWNDEFYLRLRLFEAGYREVPAEASCHPLSKYVAGSRVVWHVRVQPEYWLPPFAPRLAAALSLAGAARCAPIRQDSTVWVTTFGPVRPESEDNGFLTRDFPPPFYRVLWLTLGEHPAPGYAPTLTYPAISATRYRPEKLDALADTAAAFVDHEQAETGLSSAAMLDRYEDSFKAR